MTEPVDITADENLGRAVRIRWIDSGVAHSIGWAPAEDHFDGDIKVMECETVGLWMGESDTAVCVGLSRDAENNNWMSAQAIWKPSIIGREWL